MPLASHVASTHTLPCSVTHMDPPAARLSQPTLWTLVERGGCHWTCPFADVLQAPLEQTGSSNSLALPKITESEHVWFWKGC